VESIKIEVEVTVLGNKELEWTTELVSKCQRRFSLEGDSYCSRKCTLDNHFCRPQIEVMDFLILRSNDGGGKK